MVKWAIEHARHVNAAILLNTKGLPSCTLIFASAAADRPWWLVAYNRLRGLIGLSPQWRVTYRFRYDLGVRRVPTTEEEIRPGDTLYWDADRQRVTTALPETS
jgi:hypothetical protein